MKKSMINLALLGCLAATSNAAFADSDHSQKSNSASSRCSALPGHAALKAALTGARAAANGGFNLDMWGSIVDRDGIVCAVAFTGGNRGDQWPGSRVISAQKANTANAFSLPGLALSTANLYTATQPGGSLFGLQFSNPVDTGAAYKGPSKNYGQHNDPLVGEKIGGVNVFGGGLALYDGSGKLLGALGVSGDSSCADHNIAWRTRSALGLDHVPGGVGPGGTDGIVYDQTSGWAHPLCAVGGEDEIAVDIGAGGPAVP
ncbi:GlcG/HbpS family heme-binding protein [Methylomonas rivi]|uniref:Heme-binding protein n=1 Tax=Methylomonas rivi TaxID=2952226 RepID=A0ABT1U794_9GAMM|nr:heme-binding protein [Methylomonas sp. WSC-6]MCQ8129728.1 heme-binding protein [Methylomonas sp. WSC-6]